MFDLCQYTVAEVDQRKPRCSLVYDDAVKREPGTVLRQRASKLWLPFTTSTPKTLRNPIAEYCTVESDFIVRFIESVYMKLSYPQIKCASNVAILYGADGISI